MRNRLLSLALAIIIAAPAFAQTTRHTQILLKCRNSSRRSVAGETLIYKDCQDGKTYVSRDGAEFVELAESGEGAGSPSWATRTFSAANYTAAGSMTWTVDAGDVETETWQLVNATAVTYIFSYKQTTVGGTPSNELRVTMPFTSAVTTSIPIVCLGSGMPSNNVCFADFVAGSPTMAILRPDVANWSSGTNTVWVRGSVTLKY